MLQKNSVVNLVSKSFPVLLIVLVIAFRSVHLLGKPYLWAEDALIFLSRACQSGVSAIGESFAGYYHLLPQGTMLVAVWVSEAVTGELRIVPYISYSFALSWSAAVFAYFALGDFDWLVPGRWRRTCISLLTILLISSSTYEVWFTITNFQWWAEVFIFFAGLNVVHNWEMPKWSVLVMLTLIGYSTPAGGLTLLTVLATCCVRWQRKNFSKTDVLKLCVIALPVAVQLASVLGSDRGGTLLRVGALIQLLLKYFVVILPQNTFPEFTLFGRWDNAFLCTLFWLPLLYLFTRCREMRKALTYGLLYMFFVSVLSLLVGSEQIMNRQILNGVGCRYSFAAISIWLILVFSCISKLLACISKLFVSVSDTSGDIPRKLVAAVLMMCIVLIPYRQLPINTGSPDIWKNVEKYMCSGSGTTCWISVPPIWTYGIDVPIQTDIFEAEPSNYMLYAVDAIDGKSTAEIQESGLRIQGQPVLWVQGWAMESNKPGTVLLEANGKYVAAQPVNRIDVAEYFGIAVEKDTFNVGYIAYIPVHYLQVGENEINLVLISKDDSHCNKVPFTVSIHSIE